LVVSIYSELSSGSIQPPSGASCSYKDDWSLEGVREKSKVGVKSQAQLSKPDLGARGPKSKSREMRTTHIIWA